MSDRRDEEWPTPDGATMAIKWDGNKGAAVTETNGDTILTATFHAPYWLESLDGWCPRSPSSVSLAMVSWVPTGGVTSFAWQATASHLSKLMEEWNARYRNEAEADLRARLRDMADALPPVPPRGARGGKDGYYFALLAMYEYASDRCDYPLSLLSDVTGLSKSTVRNRVAQAREREARASRDDVFNTRVRHPLNET